MFSRRPLVSAAAIGTLALFTACSSTPMGNNGGASPSTVSAPMQGESGRVNSIEVIPVASRTSGAGAILGAVIGDLNQRRGQVQDVGARGVKKLVSALVPLRNMFGYSTRVRSLTEGRATFSMQPHSYDTLQG